MQVSGNLNSMSNDYQW